MRKRLRQRYAGTVWKCHLSICLEKQVSVRIATRLIEIWTRYLLLWLHSPANIAYQKIWQNFAYNEYIVQWFLLNMTYEWKNLKRWLATSIWSQSSVFWIIGITWLRIIGGGVKPAMSVKNFNLQSSQVRKMANICLNQSLTDIHPFPLLSPQMYTFLTNQAIPLWENTGGAFVPFASPSYTYVLNTFSFSINRNQSLVSEMLDPEFTSWSPE